MASPTHNRPSVLKQIALVVALFVGGVLLGPGIDVALGVAWCSLDWRKPVSDWLLAQGFPAAVAGVWALVWVNLPNWVVSMVVGAVIGRLSRPGRWLRHALPIALGFFAFQVFWAIAFFSWMVEDYPSMAASVLWRTLLLDLIGPLLLVLFASLFKRRRPGPAPTLAATPDTPHDV